MRVRRTAAEGIDPGDHRRLAAHLDAAARRLCAADPVAQARDRRRDRRGRPRRGRWPSWSRASTRARRAAPRSSARRTQRDAAKNRARINHVQRPQHGDAAALLPAADAGPAAAGSRSSGPAQAHRGRHHGRRPRRARPPERSAPSRGPPRASAHPARPTDGPVGVFDCFTVAKSFKAGKNTRAGSAGYPFRVVVDYRAFAYTWCRVEQIPGELMIQDPTQTVHLPDECQGPPESDTPAIAASRTRRDCSSQALRRSPARCGREASRSASHPRTRRA